MTTSLASRLDAVAPSATLAMAAKAQKLRAAGHKVYSFSVGEPDFPTPAHVVEAAREALAKGGVFHYTAVGGTPDLRSAIAEAAERDRGYKPAPEQIVVSCGAKHSLFNLAVALFQPGDEVVIPAPYWVSYPEQVRMVGATPIIVETTEADGFRLRPEALEAAITPRTKAVILCTPSNPTGAAYSRAALEALLEVLRKHDVFVIVDEIYADLVYDGFEHVSLAKLAPDLASRLIIVDGVSKTYAMTGWRIGWTIAPKPVADAILTVQGQATTNPSAISQVAAAAALRGPRDTVLAMRDAFARRRDLMVEALNAVPGIKCRTPEGAFYAFADVRGLYGLKEGSGKPLANDEDVATWLLEEVRVVTVAGTPFGAPGYLRLSYACADADITAGLAAVKDLVEKSSRA